MRLAHRLGEGHRRLARRVRQLAPDQVHARVGVGAAATDRLFEAPTDGTVGVGPGDDDEVAVEAIARVDGRAVLTQRLLEADDRLARDVAAALWEALVFQVDPRHAGLGELLHGPDRRERVPVAVVGIRDHRQGRGAGDHRGDPRDLRLREEAHVGPRVGQGHRVAAQVDRLHADLLGDLRVQRLIDAAGEQIGLLLEQPPELPSHALRHRALLRRRGRA